MECPDLDRLIDLSLGEPDPELLDHAKSCASCQEVLGLLYLLPTAAAQPEELPDRLVQLALDAVPRPRDHSVPSSGEKVVTGAMCFLIAAGGLVLTGSPAEGGPLLLLLLSLSFGVAMGILAERFVGEG